eukprot:scpid96061/ scgid0550/ 
MEHFFALVLVLTSFQWVSCQYTGRSNNHPGNDSISFRVIHRFEYNAMVLDFQHVVGQPECRDIQVRTLCSIGNYSTRVQLNQYSPVPALFASRGGQGCDGYVSSVAVAEIRTNQLCTSVDNCRLFCPDGLFKYSIWVSSDNGFVQETSFPIANNTKPRELINDPELRGMDKELPALGAFKDAPTNKVCSGT